MIKDTKSSLSKLLSLIIVLFVLNSCGIKHNSIEKDKENTIVSSDNFSNFNTEFKYAKNIRLDQFETYKLISILNPWGSGDTLLTYVLFPKGVENGNLPKANYTIGIPVDRLAPMSASAIGFLDELNAIDKISAITKMQNIYNLSIREKIDKGLILELGFSENINFELLLSSNIDMLIQTPYGPDLSSDNRISEAGIPIIYNADWLETSPLGRAEWIKFIALFIQEDEKADSIFNAIEKDYLDLSAKAKEFKQNDDVIIGALFKDVWYMPSGNSFKAILINDAGSKYYWNSTPNNGSEALGFEVVVKNQLNTNVWIEAPYKTYKDLIAADSRYGIFAAVKNKNTFHNMKQMHDDGANNYWERGVCKPNEILSDLIRIFHPQEYQAEFHYFDELK